MRALLFVEVHSQLLLVVPFGLMLLVASGVVGVVSCCLFFFVSFVGVVCGTIEVPE